MFKTRTIKCAILLLTGVLLLSLFLDITAKNAMSM